MNGKLVERLEHAIKLVRERFNVKMKRPKVGSIEGLSTVISLKQVKPNNNPRSTIGTYTSIGSHIRSLIAMHGQCKCLFCDEIYRQSNLITIIKDMLILSLWLFIWWAIWAIVTRSTEFNYVWFKGREVYLIAARRIWQRVTKLSCKRGRIG